MGAPGSGRKPRTVFVAADDRPIFARQPGESDKAWQAFEAYRDLGAERSSEKVAKRFGKSHAIISRWSARWGWRARVEAWSLEQDRTARGAKLDAIAEMNRRQASLGQGLQQGDVLRDAFRSMGHECHQGTRHQ